MPTQQSSVIAIEKLNQAKVRNQLILFDQGLPDRENKEVLWDLYGIIDTNEIVVIARYGATEFGAAGPSPLLYPVMADRIFGMDVNDRNFAGQLADQLWPTIAASIRK